MPEFLAASARSGATHTWKLWPVTKSRTPFVEAAGAGGGVTGRGGTSAKTVCEKSATRQIETNKWEVLVNRFMRRGNGGRRGMLARIARKVARTKKDR
jgi:hypothetical protein